MEHPTDNHKAVKVKVKVKTSNTPPTQTEAPPLKKKGAPPSTPGTTRPKTPHHAKPETPAEHHDPSPGTMSRLAQELGQKASVLLKRARAWGKETYARTKPAAQHMASNALTQVQNTTEKLAPKAQELGLQLGQTASTAARRFPVKQAGIVVLAICVSLLIVSFTVYARAKALLITPPKDLAKSVQQSTQLYAGLEAKQRDATADNQAFLETLNAMPMATRYAALGCTSPEELQSTSAEKQVENSALIQELQQKIVKIDAQYDSYFQQMHELLRANKSFFIGPETDYEKIIPETDLIQLAEDAAENAIADKARSMVDEALGIPSFVHTIDDGLEVWNRQPEYLRVYLAGQVMRSGATLSQYLEDGTLDEEHYVECITAYETLCSTYESLADLSNLTGDGSGALPDDFDMGSSYDQFIEQQALRKFYSQLLEEAAS